MKKLKISLAIISLFFISSTLIAQSEWELQMKATIDKQVELTGQDLSLTSSQKETLSKIMYDKFLALNIEYKAATTEDEKILKRKESGQVYSKKLDETFGVEMATKIRSWQAQYANKMKALQNK